MRVWLNKDGSATGWDSYVKGYLQANGGKFFQVLTPEESEEYIQLKLASLDELRHEEVEANYR